MEYMLLLGGANGYQEALDPEARSAVDQKIMDWFTALIEAGQFRDGRELQPPATATTVRHRGSERFVTDGPFIEAKEIIGGYAIVDVPDLDAALALAKSWPFPEATVEVRPVVDSREDSAP
jgi:hypothetical protein